MVVRALLAGMFLGLASNAFAYIDPGSGSILIQGLIAALAAAGVALKLYWHRFIGLFRRNTEEPKTSETDTSSGPSESSGPSTD